MIISIGNYRYWKHEDVLFIMRFWNKIPIEITCEETWEISVVTLNSELSVEHSMPRGMHLYDIYCVYIRCMCKT